MTADSDLSKKLAGFSLGLSVENLPGAALANAKLAILDCLGVSVLAVSSELGQIILRLAERESWQGPCTVWGSAASGRARDAALANATLAHALDFDDGGHATTYVLAATLALAEEQRSSGKIVLEAFIAGREVRRSLDAVFSKRFEDEGPGARGWHANGILGPVAAVCAAAKILHLDLDQAVNAIGLAAGSCGALGRDGGTMAKPFRAGHTAATAVLCARLAGAGTTADAQALEGNHGLLAALRPFDPSVLPLLGRDLGASYAALAPKIKKFPAGAAIHAPVAAILRLVQRTSLTPAQIDGIECNLKHYPLLRTNPVRGNEGRFSMAYCLAVAVARWRLEPEDFTDDTARDPEIRNLIQRVRHTPDSGSVTVRLKSGEKITEPLLPVPESHEWDEVAAKFQRCAGRALPDAQRAAVAEQVLHLEQLSSVADLTASLRTLAR